MPKKKTPEEYIQECKIKGYDLPIEDYVNAKTEIKHKCKYGHTYSQTPDSHLHGYGCSKCAIKKRIVNNKGKTAKRTPKQYIQECKIKGYDLPIEDYIDNNTKIKHKCKNGHIYEQRPRVHLQGQGCKYCYGNFKKTPKQHLQECKTKGYDLPIEDYKGSRIKIKYECKKGHVYKQRPDTHSGSYPSSCPICNESRGEQYILNYLDKNKIKYIPQKKFQDLKDNKKLSYDFYLPDYNILIEYQGKQHYESIDYFGGENTFKKQQIHDNLKREYAKDNGYKLLELKYTLDTQELVDRYLERRIKG